MADTTLQLLVMLSQIIATPKANMRFVCKPLYQHALHISFLVDSMHSDNMHLGKHALRYEGELYAITAWLLAAN